MNILSKIIKENVAKRITDDQAKDTGMAMVLICLIVGFMSKNILFYSVAIPLQVINMTFPFIYKPIARLWLLFSYILGTFISKLVISGVFFIVVTPVGIARRLRGCDSLQLRQWKKNKSSVFKIRNKKYELKDIEKPY